MADKKDKKAAPAPSSYGPIEIIAIFIILSTVVGIFINWVGRNYLKWQSNLENVSATLINIYARYVVFSFFLTIGLIVLLVIYIRREQKIRQKIMDKVLPPEGNAKTEAKTVLVENAKWKIVESHINSDDASKWKLAIIEADIILSELLEALDLPGDGIGEKLKSVDPNKFNHIEQAWEAHKIRNAIAHQGSDFLLTQREAKRVINLFKSVFEEFKII